MENESKIAERAIGAQAERPLKVRDGGRAGPYMSIPYIRMDNLKRVLEKHNVRFYADEHVISFDGGPEMARVSFGRSGKVEVIQAILDAEREEIRGIGE